MERDHNQFMQEGENPLTLAVNQLAGEVGMNTVNVQGDDRGDEQSHENQLQVTDASQMALDNTPGHNPTPIPHGLPNSTEPYGSNDVSTMPERLSMDDYSDIQNFSLGYPDEPYPGFDLNDPPRFGDASSFYTGANMNFDIPQQGWDAQLDAQNLNNSWYSVDPLLNEPQSNIWMTPQGYQNPLDLPYATHQQSSYGNPHQSLGAPQQNNTYAATQLPQQPKRGPGRPQGGSLPDHELMTRLPIRYSGMTGATRGNSSLPTLVKSFSHEAEDLESGEDSPKAPAGTKQKTRHVAARTPAKRSRSSSKTSPFITIRDDMTAEELRKASKHNQTVQLDKINADRARNNMSAKRGRYKRMACNIAMLDEVYRLSLEVQRAHEELHAEKLLNAQLIRQLESAGIPPALPYVPAAAGSNDDGTVQDAPAVQQSFLNSANVHHGSADIPAKSPLPALDTAYGPDEDGKYRLPTDHLALDESWFRKTEATRKELLKDMPTKVAALEGGCLEEMQEVIDKGNMIRGLVADFETNRGVVWELPGRQAADPSSAPVSSNTTSVKRKTTTISDDQDETEDDDHTVRRSTRKSVKFN
ncbi:hypothetical protein DL546_009582 [Coniochaeta pulveracea]|uniref:BZIP domain-containing protein n=1 Tax=Coniochaeta pulveracea TaxID=177199 RepID=A0A420YM53_9PEZI|nr:hypothetical protein DL546_009582 [Coniochaeta pulveracea]